MLLIFQAMDAAGKDGAIKYVMSGVNPQGCRVFSFKHPSAPEMFYAAGQLYQSFQQVSDEEVIKLLAAV